MNAPTVTDYFNASAAERANMLTPPHGRRRAAASPFDEIARTNTDGTPYWSARDLADEYGWTV